MSTRVFRFLLVGSIGFLVDSGLTLGLIALGFSPLLARPPAILVAMVFTWLANRHVTFAVGNKRSVSEAARYSVVALLAAMANYLIYSALIALALPPLPAIVIATGIAAVFSYYGYKNFAFGMTTRP